MLLIVSPDVQGCIVFEGDNAYLQLNEDPKELKKRKVVSFYVTQQ